MTLAASPVVCSHSYCSCEARADRTSLKVYYDIPLTWDESRTLGQLCSRTWFFSSVHMEQRSKWEEKYFYMLRERKISSRAATRQHFTLNLKNLFWFLFFYGRLKKKKTEQKNAQTYVKVACVSFFFFYFFSPSSPVYCKIYCIKLKIHFLKIF